MVESTIFSYANKSALMIRCIEAYLAGQHQHIFFWFFGTSDTVVNKVA